MCYILTHSAIFNGASGAAQGGTAHTHHSPVITQLENTHAPLVCAPGPSLEHQPMNIQLLLLQQAGNARAWDCPGECVPPLGHCSLCLFDCPAPHHHTDTGHYPQASIAPSNNSIINVKHRNAGEEKPPSSQQGPSVFPGWVRFGLFQGIQQCLWEQLTLRETAAPAHREIGISIPGTVSLTTT